MNQIQLHGKNGNGKYALVDEEDFPILNRYRWNFWHGAVLRTFHEHGIVHVWYMHRIIMNPRSNKEVDHINGNPLDNRKENLRILTHQENLWNMKMRKTNKSGYVGVKEIKNRKGIRYKATLKINEKFRTLGYYNTPEEATAKRDEAIARYRKGIKRDFSYQFTT